MSGSDRFFDTNILLYLAIYDAMILASAQLAGCEVVFTEDLQHHQEIDGGLRIINPFRS